MVSFKLEWDAEVSAEEKKALEEARKLPVVYDGDCPELTADMERAFIEARKNKPYDTEPLTLYVSPATIQKAKAIGGDYIKVLGHLLDRAVHEYMTM